MVNRGLIAIALTGLALWLWKQKAEAAPPEEPPTGRDIFYMPPIMKISIREHDILQWHYHEIRCTVTITNLGTAPGTHTIRWEDRYDPPGDIWRSGSKTITLGPGESYEWSIKGDIDFSRTNIYTCELHGDWETDNYSEGKVIEGVPTFPIL